LNVHGVKYVRRTEIHTAEPSVPPESSFIKIEIAIEMLKICKSPGIGPVPAELLQTEGNTFHSEIHRFINFILNKEELPEQLKESTILSFDKDDKTDGSNYRGISLLSNCVQHFIQHYSAKVNSTCRRHYWESSAWISTSSVKCR
jgi:hypothetical protein